MCWSAFPEAAPLLIWVLKYHTTQGTKRVILSNMYYYTTFQVAGGAAMCTFIWTWYSWFQVSFRDILHVHEFISEFRAPWNVAYSWSWSYVNTYYEFKCKLMIINNIVKSCVKIHKYEFMYEFMPLNSWLRNHIRIHITSSSVNWRISWNHGWFQAEF